MRTNLKTIAAILGLLLPAAITSARPDYCEMGDAGENTSNSQDVDGGLGTVGHINGVIQGVGVGADDFEDMYRINITDPLNFQARIVTGDPEADVVPQLWLFRGPVGQEGLGLLGNNGVGLDYTGALLLNQSTDGTGIQLTDPGLYFLAISGQTPPLDRRPNRLPRVTLDGGADGPCPGPVVAPVVIKGDTCLEMNLCSLSQTQDMSFRVTIPFPGDWIFSLCGAPWDTLLFVSEDCCDFVIASNDDACGLASELILDLSAFVGDVFVTIEGGAPGACGPFELVIDSASPGQCPFFPGAQEYGAGNSPRSVATGDLDGDGDIDLAVANGNGNDVSVLLNNGDGTFAPDVTYGAGVFPFSVATGDLDGDDDLDLAVANAASDDVSVLLNDGDGTFALHVTYDAGIQPVSVATGDLDGDSDIDLAVANGSTNDVSVLLNDGDGTFAPGVTYGAGTAPPSVATGDLDGDSDIDIAVANNLSDNVSVLLNDGDGTFAPDVTYGVGGVPFSVATGDLDGDGDIDLAVANSGTNDVSVLLNNGDGTFAADVTYGAGDGPRSVVTGDLDGNGGLDLAVANGDSDDVSVLLNACAPAGHVPQSASGSIFVFDPGFEVSGPDGPGGGDPISQWADDGDFGSYTVDLRGVSFINDCPGDIDDSGARDFGDIIQILSHWGDCPQCDFDEDFDDYAPGLPLIPQQPCFPTCPPDDSWQPWDFDPGAGMAIVTDTQSRSPAHSLRIQGPDDIVRTLNGFDSGVWVFTAHQYVPATFTGMTAFIMLNTYTSSADANWSLQIGMDGDTGTVADLNGAGVTLPLVRNRWVEIRVVIDLDADTQRVFYDDEFLLTKSWTEGVTGGGALDIAAVDLFGFGSTAVFYDDLSLCPLPGPDPCPTDLNGNTATDFADLLQVLGLWGPCPP